MNLGCSKPREGQFVMVLLEAFEPNALPTYLRKKNISSQIQQDFDSKKLDKISRPSSSDTHITFDDEKQLTERGANNSFRKYRKPSSFITKSLAQSGDYSENLSLSPMYKNSNKLFHNRERKENNSKGPFITEIDDELDTSSTSDRQPKRPKPKIMENYVKQREYDDYLHSSLQRRTDIYANGKEKKTASFSRAKANTLSKAPPSLPSLSQRNLFTTPTCGKVSLDSVKPTNLKVGLVIECKEKDAVISILFKDGVFLHYFNVKEVIPYNRLVVLTNDEYKLLLGEAWMERLIDFEMGTSKTNFSFSPNRVSDTKSKEWVELRKKMMTALNKLKKRKGIDDEMLRSPTMQDLMKELEDGNEETFLETYREGAPNKFHKEEEEEKEKIFTKWNERLESFHALRLTEQGLLSQKRNTTLRDLSESLSNKMGHLMAYEEAIMSAFQSNGNENSNPKEKRSIIPSLNSSIINSSQVSTNVAHNFISPRTPRTFFMDHLSGKILPGKVVFIDPISLIMNIIVTYQKKPITDPLLSPRMMNSPRTRANRNNEEAEHTASIMIYLYLDKISFIVDGENTASTAYGPLTTKLIGKQVLVYIPTTTIAITKSNNNGKEINSLDTSLPCDVWLVSEGDDCLKATQMIKKDILSIDLPERIWINKWVVEQGLAALHFETSDSRIEEHNLTSISKPFITQQMRVLKDAEIFAKNHDMGIWGVKNQIIKIEKERERIKRWKFRTGKSEESSKHNRSTIYSNSPPKESSFNESLFREADRKYMIEMNY